MLVDNLSKFLVSSRFWVEINRVITFCGGKISRLYDPQLLNRRHP